MPPKRGKAAGRKAKQPVAEPIPDNTTEATSTEVANKNGDVPMQDTKPDDGDAEQATVSVDAPAEEQASAQVEALPEGATETLPEEPTNKAQSGEEGKVVDPPVEGAVDEDVVDAQSEQKATIDTEPETRPKPKTEPKSTARSARSKKGKPAEAEVDEVKADDTLVTQANPEPEPEVEPEAEPEPKAKPASKGKLPKSNKRKAAVVAEEKASEPEPALEDVLPEQDKPASRPSKKSKKDPIELREGERKSERGAKQATATKAQILNYLLSDAALDLCRPDDEAEEIRKGGSSIKTYSASVLNPFEELLCAVVLSRPISHRLGLRTIRTVLNAPYHFSTPKSIADAGKEKVRQAMEDAHTQHKDKTAEQIALIADVVTSHFSKDAFDSSLEKVREQGNNDWDGERDLLQKNIKGLGRTGLDIFFRRTQWLWDEAFPFVDERTARGADKLGLPRNADKLLEALEKNWAKLDTASITGDNKAEKIRRAFVLICERATGADLEGQSQALLDAAASSSS